LQPISRREIAGDFEQYPILCGFSLQERSTLTKERAIVQLQGRVVPRRRLGEYLARFQATPEFYDEIACMLLELMGRAARGDRKSWPGWHVRTHISLTPERRFAREPSCDTSDEPDADTDGLAPVDEIEYEEMEHCRHRCGNWELLLARVQAARFSGRLNQAGIRSASFQLRVRTG